MSKPKKNINTSPNPAIILPLAGDATDDALLREYQELCNNMRHYGNVRLSRLTMFFALSGGLLALIHGGNPVNMPDSNLLKLAGVVLAILFWAVDFDVVFNWRCFRDRAIEIEAKLHLQQYTLRRQRKGRFLQRILSETNSTYGFYAMTIVFWMIEFFT